ncbi:hypothetical protein [Streptomyces sp. LS1784]|uniref:hypothetical protein n=1 Tax=Streptomyces sp. LS1784 TaxID=2851533 RepID=UPI001CCE7D4F|nr:hypothetical protein [Streptomyces sp. LS1784]
MRALKRAVAVGALAVPLVVGCAGLASATEGIDANFGKGFFVANRNGAGVAAVESHVGPDGISHAGSWIRADDNGVSGSFAGSGAGTPQADRAPLSRARDPGTVPSDQARPDVRPVPTGRTSRPQPVRAAAENRS